MPRIPTNRLVRTAKFGGLVAGQGARWAGGRVANRLRSEEAAEAADAKRAMALADEIVRRLGEMKGAAMKLGQVLSTVDFELVPEGEREEFKRRLAALRDQAPKVPFEQMERVVAADLGGAAPASATHAVELDLRSGDSCRAAVAAAVFPSTASVLPLTGGTGLTESCSTRTPIPVSVRFAVAMLPPASPTSTCCRLTTAIGVSV